LNSARFQEQLTFLMFFSIFFGKLKRNRYRCNTVKAFRVVSARTLLFKMCSNTRFALSADSEKKAVQM
jgi:hypothetical protein